ncbi:MAG: GerMN domain-containing protein [Candidatus Colwellbacteria bacterium]|nr:GerMN domain-containing protein [Candidatus Colwellbacteria bacterium]
MSKNIVVQAAIRVGIVLFLAISTSVILMVTDNRNISISDFDSCALKYPVMESYPRRCAVPGGKTFTEKIISEPIITSPTSGSSVSHRVLLEGTAPGNWFFEASFPVSIEDSSGNIIATSHVTALSDWMTTLPIRFSGTIDLPTDYSGPAKLVFKKDNPSGIPENDARMEISVSVTPSDETINLMIFFGKNSPDSPVNDCDKVFGLSRQIIKTESVGKTAIDELLKGPTMSEKEAGYFTSINDGVKMKSISMKDGIVYIDFDDSLEKEVGGSCRVSAIRTQIVRTLMQFPTVESVVISINGRTEDILQP